MEFVIVIAVLVTVTVATGVATQLYEMKIESNFKKDLLVNNAQIVVDKDGKQKIYLYDEEGALIKMDRGAEQYSKYIIKQMKKQTQLLQDEMKKAQKEAEKAQKQTEKYLKESEILKRELEKNKEEFEQYKAQSKEEITKYKAQYEADVLKSLKSGYSSESSGGLSRDEADLPLISFIKTTNLDGKSISEIHESLEQVKTKNEKIQIKSKFFSLSTAGAASREEHSGTEESYIDNHKSRGSSHSFSDTTSRGESSGENTSQPRHRAHSISRLFKSIDEKDENDPSEADRGSGSLTSTESRSSLQKNPESKGILHKLISSASPGVSRRELPKKPTDHKSKLDATKKRIEKLKGSAGFSRKSKTDQEGSESQTESLKIDSVKLASSMEPELHHKSEKLSYHDGAKHRTSEGRPHRKRAEEKKLLEAAEDVETKVLKQKSSEGHVHRKIRREEKVLVEHTETGEIIIHHKAKTISSEHQSKHKRIEEKDRPKTKLITSISPERADNIDVKEKVKISMSLECSFKREEVMQDTSKLRIEEINIAKLDAGSSPKIPFRSPDKPITISLVSSADNIVDTNDSPVCERRTNIEYTKNSGSRSNIYEKQEKEPVKLASQITPLRLSSDLLPQEMDARVEVIEALISGKYTPENTPLNLSGEIVSLPSDHVIQ